MKDMMLKYFRPMEQGSLYEQWLSVVQEGTVEDYQKKFVQLAAPLEGIPEEILLASFIRGLNEKIKVELRVMDPKTLERAMEWASRLEAKINIGHTTKWSTGRTGPVETTYKNGPMLSKPFLTKFPSVSNSILNASPTHKPPNTTSQNTTPWKNTNNPIPPSNIPRSFTRKLTDKELQEKKERGLCFRCDEKWKIGHQCKKKELSVLIFREEEFEDEDEEESEHVEEEISPPPSINVSLNSVIGIDNPKTLKLLGILEGRRLW